MCLVSGTMTLIGGTVSDNFAGNNGGGLEIASGTMTLTDVTVSNNSASHGDGLWSDGTATLTNCTVSGNSASCDGGGVWNAYYGTPNSGTTTLTNCTVSGNTPAATAAACTNINGTDHADQLHRQRQLLRRLRRRPVQLQRHGHLGNTIVAGNTASTSGPDAFGTFTSQGNNLIGETDGSTGWVGSDLTGTIASPLNAVLAPLGNYGGPTQTMALLPGSPAIDAGNNALIPAGVTTDQRGYFRIYNGTVDIGAFESNFNPPLSEDFRLTEQPDPGRGRRAGQFDRHGHLCRRLAPRTSPISVTWASATPSVATISDTGLASAPGPGHQRDHRVL